MTAYKIGSRNMLCLRTIIYLIAVLNYGCVSNVYQPESGKSISWFHLIPDRPDILLLAESDAKTLDKDICLYNRKNNKRQIVYSEHASVIYPVGYASHNNSFLILGVSGDYHWINLDTGKAKALENYPGIEMGSAVLSATLSQDSNLLAEIIENRGITNVHIVDLRTSTRKIVTNFTDSLVKPSLFGEPMWSANSKYLYFPLDILIWSWNYAYPTEVPKEHRSGTRLKYVGNTIGLLDVTNMNLIPDYISADNSSCMVPSSSNVDLCIAFLMSNSLFDRYPQKLAIQRDAGERYILLDDTEPYFTPRWSTDMRFVYAVRNGMIVRVRVPNRFLKGIQ